MHFLPVGHTHVKIDQRFSRVSVKLQAVDTLTLPQLMEEVASLFHTLGEVYHESIPNMGDFWSIFNYQACESVHGVATSRTAAGKVDVKVLRFFKDDHGRPVFVYKQFDQSTGGRWSGHHKFDHPLCMFKDGRIEWPQVIQVAPRIPIENLSEVKAKVAALIALTPSDTSTEAGEQDAPTLRVAEKVQDFKAWWDELFDEEHAFWSMHHPNFPADERRWPLSAHWAIPMQQAEGPTSIQRITNPEYLDASHLRPGQWDDTLVGEALQALTKSQDDLPPGVAAPEQTHTLVWLGNDKPLHKELYRPEQDLEDGDIALVLYKPQNTPQEQGWEIVK